MSLPGGANNLANCYAVKARNMPPGPKVYCNGRSSEGRWAFAIIEVCRRVWNLLVVQALYYYAFSIWLTKHLHGL